LTHRNTEGQQVTAATHTKESIQALLERSDQAVYKALLAIYNRQTAAEQAGHHTREVNGVGFSRFDAPFLTDMVRGYLRYESLTPKQLAITRNKMKRYWRQLVEIANSRTPSLYADRATPSAVSTMESLSPDSQGDHLVSHPPEGRTVYEDGHRVASRGSW
jgi:hypothetical protein